MLDYLDGGKPLPRRQSLRGWRNGFRIDLGFIGVLTVVVIFLIGCVDARSPHPPPLRRLHHPSSSKIRILPRRFSHSSRNFTPRSPHHSTLVHSDSLLISLSLPSLLPQPAELLLRPTEYLFHPNAKTTYEDGRVERLRQEDWKVYTGEVIRPNWVERVWQSELAGLDIDEKAILGSARIMVHHPGDDSTNAIFEGVFDIFGENYNILTQDHYDRVKTSDDVRVSSGNDGLIVFRDRDMRHDQPVLENQSSHSCNHDKLAFNSNISHPVWQNFDTPLNTFFPHQRRDDTGGMTSSTNFINSINSSAGCPNTQQIVYMGVALDCNYISTYGSTDAARTQVLNDWNQVSALYKKTFNISLGIIDLVVQNATCPTTAVKGTEWNIGCSSNITLDSRLSSFSQWRGDRGSDGVGLWHLMSACPTDSEVGVAWLGTLCQTSSSFQSGSFVSGTAISTATKTEWSLISHEIGHGFGAIHDCESGCSLSGPCCPFTSGSCDAGGRFIMNPTTAPTEVAFSGCTLGNICSNIGSKALSTSCIQSPGTQTVISLSQCGNGILEAGEECDPGQNATSACCDASTCKFATGAVCDPSNSACCTSSCQLASAGVVCRPAVDPTCDIAETCTGTNATCPADVTASDGKSCGSGLSCASGTCTSLNLQCQTAGASMNLTTACGQKDDTSCVVTCKSPGSSNQCIVLQTPLVDGSPCGYGGHCYNQTCAAGSTEAAIAGWYTQNLQIAIPVTVIAGLIVLILLFLITRCIWRCCARDNTRRKPPTIPPTPMRQSALNGTTYRQSGPRMTHRNADSVTSIDPITRTSLVSREPSPSSFNSHVSVNGNGNGNGNGYGQYLGPEDYGPTTYMAWQPQVQGSRGGEGWVDDRQFNGPNYGVEEARSGYGYR